MDTERLRRLAGCYLAAGVLILVALTQKYNVYVHDQLAGRGGGFGMFSTVDVAPSRMIRFYLLTDQGEALVIDPRRTRVLGSFYVERILIKPTDEILEDAATKIASTPWRIFEKPDLEAVFDQLPDDLQSYLDKDLIWHGRSGLQSNSDSSAVPQTPSSYPSRFALPGKTGPGSIPYELRGVRVELWTSTFNADTHMLVANKLKEVVFPGGAER